MTMMLRSLITIVLILTFPSSKAIARTGGSASTPQTTPRGATPPSGRGSATSATRSKIDANLLQLMRGIVFPASNVVFAGQRDLGGFAAAPDPAVSPNPLTSTYGGWQAIENAALALAESANLLVLPGRMCSSGRLAPVRRADWLTYVQGLRDAGIAAYKAAQSKSQDAMVDASGTVAEACSACHDVYREKRGGLKDRCLP